MESKIDEWPTTGYQKYLLELSAQIFVYHYPSLRKQLTRHCCNSLHSLQVNCLLSSFVASFITGRSIWSCLIKYYIHNEDYCWIWQMKNKRPMGHIAHLRKKLKSINTYDYIITLIKRWKKTIIIFMRIKWFFIWTKLNPIHQRLRRRLFHNYLPLEKGGALHLNKVESPSVKDALWQVWFKFAQWF